MIKTAVNFARRYSHINWALADQTMVSGSNFVTGILLARMLGIAEFGRFTLAWMVVLFVQSIQYAAINAPMMSIGPQQEAADRPAYYGAVFLQQIMFAVLSATITFAGVKASAVFFPDWGVAPLALPLTAVVFFSQIQDFLRRYYFTIETPILSFIGDAVRYLGQITILFGLYFMADWEVTGTIALWVMAGAAMAGGLALLIFVRGLVRPRQFFAGAVRRHWHFSKWMVASSLLQWTTGNLFIVAAGIMLGATAVGALKAAQNLMGITHILFQGLENIVPMRAAKHYLIGGVNSLNDYLRRLAWLGGLGTAAIAGIFAIIPEFWLNLFYGDQYVTYGYLVRWYAIIYVLVFLGLPLRFGLRTLEETRPVFFAYAGSTLFATLSAYTLVNILGLTGVMIGMLSIQAIMQFTMWFAYRNRVFGFSA